MQPVAWMAHSDCEYPVQDQEFNPHLFYLEAIADCICLRSTKIKPANCFGGHDSSCGSLAGALGKMRCETEGIRNDRYRRNRNLVPC